MGCSLREALAGMQTRPAVDQLSSAVADRELSGVTHDSRRVASGDLFVAWRGERFDARRYAGQAVQRGAAAVLADGPRPEDTPEVPWIQIDDPRAAMGDVAARVYGHADRELLTVGVTGTNGKTTVVFLLESLLREAGFPCGLLGTLGYRFGDHDHGGERTTPEGSDLHRLLATMRHEGARAVAMEVSSHALDQGRVAAMRYDVAVFTNLTRDHLDYHHDFENYYLAKRRLFDLLKDGGGAVVGVDDAWGRRLVDEVRSAGEVERVVTFAGDGDGADVRPVDVTLDLRGIRGQVSTPRGVLEFETRLMGRYNLLNVLALIAVAEVLEIERGVVRRALASVDFVDGRLHPVTAGQAFPVLIDFAHTDGALEAALESMRSLWPGRIVVVFGCGGERDQGKRPLMGEAAGRGSDLAIVTSDNPRREDPQQILQAVEEGVRRSGGDYRVEPDRRRAIAEAIALAAHAEDGDWAVLIAGKGHEREQILGDERLPFDDRAEAEASLRALENAVQPGAVPCA